MTKKLIDLMENQADGQLKSMIKLISDKKIGEQFIQNLNKLAEKQIKEARKRLEISEYERKEAKKELANILKYHRHRGTTYCIFCAKQIVVHKEQAIVLSLSTPRENNPIPLVKKLRMAHIDCCQFGEDKSEMS